MSIRRVIRMGHRRQREAKDKIDTINEEEDSQLTSRREVDDIVNVSVNVNVNVNNDVRPRKGNVIDRKNRGISNGSRSNKSRSSSSSNKNNNNNSSSKTNRDSNHRRKNARSSNRNASNNRRKTRVHWNPKVEKKRHVMLNDLTIEERDSVWYNENDTKIILAMAKITVKMMMKNELCDDIDYCSRGLEGKTLIGSKKRNRKKSIVRKAVLTEQEVQRMDRVMIPEKLANASMKYTKDVTEARDYANQDEQDIMEYLNDMRIISKTIHRVDHDNIFNNKCKNNNS